MTLVLSFGEDMQRMIREYAPQSERIIEEKNCFLVLN